MSRRILFFITSLGGGGAESHTLRILNHLDRSRWAPSLAVVKGGGSYEQFLSPDVRIHDVSGYSVASSAGRLLLSAPRLRALVRRERPSLVCSVMDVVNMMAVLTLATMTDPPKLALCVQMPPKKGFAQSPLRRRMLLSATRHLFVRADRVIALSKGVKNELADIDPRLHDRTTVIHNACVDDRILSAATAAPPDSMPDTKLPVIVAAGRLQPEKDYPTLIEAFALVKREIDAELWILGEGPERARIERRIQALGLGDSVRLLGFQDAPQAFMRRATVFALTSLYEGFGNVIVESLAVGTPVVATDCPYGPREILGEQEGGLLAPVGDPAALANALRRLIMDPELRASLSEIGRAHV